MRCRLKPGAVLLGMAGALATAVWATPAPEPIRCELAGGAGSHRLRVLIPYDSGVAGYFLERRDPRGGGFVRLSLDACPPAPPGAEEGWLEFDVAGAGTGAVFRLSGLSISGVDMPGRPFAPPSAAAPPVRAALPVRSVAAVGLTSASSSAPGDRVKVRVAREGLCMVSASEISACLSGVDESEILARIPGGNLRVRCGTNDVAWCPAPGGTGVWFYGEAIDSIYTRWNVYWIDLQPGVRMETQTVASAEPTAGTSFRETLHVERDQRFFFNNVIYTNAEDDIWFWAYVQSPRVPSAALAFDVPAPAPGDLSGELTVHMKGATELAEAPEHHARVYLNGAVLGTSDWARLSSCDPTFPVTNLVAGSNTVVVEGFKNPGDPALSYFIVDSLDLSYRRLHEAASNALAFRGGTNAAVTVSGMAGTNIWLLDVTNPRRPVVVTGARVDADTSGLGRVSFVPRTETSRYEAVCAVQGPDGVTGRPMPSLGSPTNGADFVILAPAVLVPAAEAWANHRRGEGWVSRVVDIEDVYDASSGGVVTPWAIRSSIATARSAWARPPRYVLLAGAGTLDYRDVNGAWASDPCLIPPVLVATPYGLYGSDGPLADGDGDHVPEVALGRLPVATSNELTALLEKTRAYEGGAINGRTVEVVADNLEVTEGIDFPASSDRLIPRIPAVYDCDSNYLSTQSVEQVRARLFAALDAGCTLVTYVGHANDTILAAEGILRATDVASLTNATRAPVLLAMACLFGRFDRPSSTGGLAENLVRQSTGGFCAVWSCTAQTQNDDNTSLGDWMLRALFRRPGVRLGAAARLALESYAASAWAKPSVLDSYTLLGDPLLDARLTDGSPATYAEWIAVVFTPEQQADTAISGADADPDRDGARNSDECEAGTRPLDRTSCLAITAVDVGEAESRRICWPGMTQRVYAVEHAAGAGASFATILRGIWGDPSGNCATDRVARGEAAPVYRVRLQE